MEDKNFEEMQRQFALLKEQLNKQEIVSDRLLRQTMKLKTNDIGKTKKITYIAAVFCIIIYPLLYLSGCWSLPFTIVTLLMMVFCMAQTYYIHRPVDRLNLMSDDFVSVARVISKFKKQYNKWLIYFAPILGIPWLAWACYDFAGKQATDASKLVSIIFIIIGAGIGWIIGYHFHRKAVNAAQDILDEIEMD